MLPQRSYRLLYADNRYGIADALGREREVVRFSALADGLRWPNGRRRAVLVESDCVCVAIDAHRHAVADAANGVYTERRFPRHTNGVIQRLCQEMFYNRFAKDPDASVTFFFVDEGARVVSYQPVRRAGGILPTTRSTLDS